MAKERPDEREPPGASRIRPYVPGLGPPAAPPPQSPPPPSEGTALRPYLLTGGRVGPSVDSLEIEAQIMTTDLGRGARAQHTFEYRDLVVACDTPMSVAEAAAKLGLQIGVIRVLVGDLVSVGHLSVLRPDSGLASDVETIERVIRGLQSLS